MDTEEAISTTKDVLRGFGLDDDTITRTIESGFNPEHDLISTDIAIKFVLTTLEEQVGAIHPAPATVAILREGPFGICLNHDYTTADLNRQLADGLSQTPYSVAVADGDGHDLSIKFTSEDGDVDVTTTFSYPSTRFESSNFPAVATSINILLAEHSDYRIVLLRSVDSWSAIVVPEDRLGQVQDQYGDNLSIGGLAARDPDGLTEYLQTPVPDRYLDTDDTDESSSKEKNETKEEREDTESTQETESSEDTGDEEENTESTVDVPDSWGQDSDTDDPELDPASSDTDEQPGVDGDTSPQTDSPTVDKSTEDNGKEEDEDSQLVDSEDEVQDRETDSTESSEVVETSTHEESDDGEVDFVGKDSDFDSDIFESEESGEEAGEASESDSVDKTTHTGDKADTPTTDSTPTGTDSEPVLDVEEIPETAPEKDDRDQIDRQDPNDIPDVLDDVNVKESVKPAQGEFEEVTASVDLAAKLKEAERRLAEDEVLDWDDDDSGTGRSLTEPLVDTGSEDDAGPKQEEEDTEIGEEENGRGEPNSADKPPKQKQEARTSREQQRRSGMQPNPDLVPEVQPGVDFDEEEGSSEDEQEERGLLGRIRELLSGM